LSFDYCQCRLIEGDSKRVLWGSLFICCRCLVSRCLALSSCLAHTHYSPARCCCRLSQFPCTCITASAPCANSSSARTFYLLIALCSLSGKSLCSPCPLSWCGCCWVTADTANVKTPCPARFKSSAFSPATCKHHVQHTSYCCRGMYTVSLAEPLPCPPRRVETRSPLHGDGG
jgi:hypothetical protein